MVSPFGSVAVTILQLVSSFPTLGPAAALTSFFPAGHSIHSLLVDGDQDKQHLRLFKDTGFDVDVHSVLREAASFFSSFKERDAQSLGLR